MSGYRIVSRRTSGCEAEESLLGDGPYVSDPDATPMSGEAAVLYRRSEQGESS